MLKDKKIKVHQTHSEDTLEFYGSKGRGHKIQFGNPQSKRCKILFGHPIVPISPNYPHTPSVTNQKWTRLNATPLRRLLINKLASQEDSLKDTKNYLTIYEYKATLFQNMNNNQRGARSIIIKFPSLLRRENLHWSLLWYVVQRKQD